MSLDSLYPREPDNAVAQRSRAQHVGHIDEVSANDDQALERAEFARGLKSLGSRVKALGHLGGELIFSAPPRRSMAHKRLCVDQVPHDARDGVAGDARVLMDPLLMKRTVAAGLPDAHAERGVERRMRVRVRVRRHDPMRLV